MSKVLGRIRTADGYVFFHLADDSIVDSLDPASVDMSWASLRQFAHDRCWPQINMTGGLGIDYEFEDGSRGRWTVSRYAYDKEQYDNERQNGEHEESI